jgi:hypothetical protein
MAAGARERIDAALAAAPATTLALGWATVETDRAVTELTEALGLPADAFSPAEESVALGAWCRIARGVLAGGRSLAILEPSTEGRLAATLARHDEGPVAVWLEAPADSALPTDEPLSAARPGPFGAERLVLTGPVYGPHRLLVGTRPGTIAS